jgi:septal ring factor EnvC (AmiA/AmiB activator)
VTPLEAEGFDVFGALPERPAQPRSTKEASARQAKEELREAKARVRELERQLREAERKAQKLEAEWQKGKDEAESARVALAEAEQELKRLDPRS